MNNLKYWLPLHFYNPFLFDEVKKLLEVFDSIETFWSAPKEKLIDIVDNDRMSNFLKFRSEKNLNMYEEEIRRLYDLKITIFPFTHEGYPDRLKSIKQPPLVVFHKGILKNFDKTVAIVGTRDPSHFGHKRAREISQELAEKGYTIVSGLARGIDTEAHCGALNAKDGKTIAVLGTNIDSRIYPKENIELALDIIASGALISEKISFQEKIMGHKGRYEFINRNRIISGISRCVIVIESGGGGGTAHQVKFTLKQGRRLFIMEPKSRSRTATKGFKAFVEQGGTSFSSSEEILEYLANSRNKMHQTKISGIMQ